MDNEIYNLENQLPQSVESARIAKTIATRDGKSVMFHKNFLLLSFPLADYELQVSYGTAIIMANVMYTANVIWDKNVTDFTAVDWGTIAANTGYAWGYSGLWLVDGQLESPDPGCGLQVIMFITCQ